MSQIETFVVRHNLKIEQKFFSSIPRWDFLVDLSHRGGMRNCIFLQLSHVGMDFWQKIPPR